MAFLTANEFAPSGDPVIDVLADGVAWNAPAGTVTWALADGLDGEVWTDRGLAIRSFSDALAAIAQFIDLRFTYLGDFSNPVVAGQAGADIVYTLDNAPTTPGTLAYAYFPGPGVFGATQYATEGGDVFLNLSRSLNSTSSFLPGSDGFLTVLHEIGHALGLKHPFETSLGRPSIASLGRDDILDVDWMTMMSYNDPFDSELERWDPATPMVLDVLALQYIYGPNLETHAGDSLHRLTPQDYLYTLWDASGRDMVDLSAMPEGWSVTLPETRPSTQEPTRVGLAVKASEARDTLADITPTELIWLMGEIEDARGTGYSDTLTGSERANLLMGEAGNDLIEGRRGNDTIDGGAGVDTSLHAAAQRSVTLALSPDGIMLQDRRPTGEGTDTLRDIELLAFGGDPDGAGFDLRQHGGAASLSGEALETFIELYIAYFNRAPDAVGLAFWGTAFANGVTLEQTAALFIDQLETRTTYPPGLTNADFVGEVYWNVLGRSPDEAGQAFWNTALDTGAVARDQFILEILRGAKADPDPGLGQGFIDQQLADRAYLATKTDIGAYYAVHRGLSDVGDAAEVMALFDGTMESTRAAYSVIDDLYADALDPQTGQFLLQLVGVLDVPAEAMV